MLVGALGDLVAGARSLPGEKRPAGTRPQLRASVAPDGDEAIAPPALRARVGALLAELARRLEAALPAALACATRAWDQVDALTLLDGPLRAEAAALGRAAAALAADDDPPTAAAGTEAALTLEAALGLVVLVERRLATLVRLRLRAADPELLPGGRPFLDLAAAFAEAARAWMP
jgi:hypothetical protein